MTGIFTSMEIIVIGLIANGKTNTEIAELLFIAENTVKTHRKNILRKSPAKNFLHLVANCVREGLIQ